MRAGAYVIITAVSIAAALSGCTRRTLIRPEALPVVTEAAARDPEAPVEVVDTQGIPVTLKGRFDGVVVTRNDREETRDEFEAPVTARIQGPWLTLSSSDDKRSYLPSHIAEVELHHYNTTGAIVVGTILTVIGAGFTVLGGIGIGAGIAAENEYSGVYVLVIGVPLLSVGIGLGAGGIPLLVAGSRTPEANRPARAPQRSDAPAIWVGPGGLRGRF